MRASFLALSAVLMLTSGCGDRLAGADTTSSPVPVASPTVVPAAQGTVVTSQLVFVSDDGSGPWMCASTITDLMGGPPKCHDFAVANWDWDSVSGSHLEDGVRWGSYVLTGTFDGTTFSVGEATQPHPAPHGYDSDVKIPCPTPEGGWQVLDSSLTTQDTLTDTSTAAEWLGGYATMTVSTPDGGPGGRDPLNTVVSVYVVGDVQAAEAELRQHWGGMLCVTQVERSQAALHKVQSALMDVPGRMVWGGGNAANQVELTVFNDDGSIQRWADQEFGEGLVVVHSILQPAT